MDTLAYLARLAIAVVVGMVMARFVFKRRFSRFFSILQLLMVLCLLFFMGVNTGSIEGIVDQLGTIGTSALVCTVASLAGTIALSLVVSRFIGKKKPLDIAIAPRKEQSIPRRIWDILKEPLFLVSIVVAGLLLRLHTPLFGWFRPSFISDLLYGLLFCVGVGMVNRKLPMATLFADKSMLVLPLVTIVGSYLGALFVPLFCPYTVSEALGIVSGFGWYSLSGILIGDLGFPILGSVSFLSNLFRESFSFFLIPLMGRLGARYYMGAVCSAGATSMDVTLPLLTTHFGSSTIASNLYHGVMMSLLCPLLIPLFF